MYREEHPNPQLKRSDWINLNGEWDFEFDFSVSGKDRKLFEKKEFSKKINVPFCPESKLSGIEYKDFLNSVWYLKKLDIPDAWRKSGRIFVNFGAVDYFATVYLNGKEVGTHKGGYTAFKFDITDYLSGGENILTLNAVDDNRSGKQPKGKQSDLYYSHDCDYTRTTGIWQTVWLEHTPECYIKDFRFYPDVQNCKLDFEISVEGAAELSAVCEYEGRNVGSTSLSCSGGTYYGSVQLSEKHLWEVGCGRLYDVTLKFGDDTVKSYFGLRSVRIDGNRVLINEKSVFQRLVLDQGFYPDGIYTAPTKEALENDILLSLNAGFNGARLHEKVFEPYFLYYCDKHGYITWGEYANWGINYSDPKMLEIYLGEWHEAVAYSFNHPSIIGWCPFNETWDYNGESQYNPLIYTVYRMTKAWDKTRPCIDTSGNYHTETDIYDVHDYFQDPEEFASHYKNLGKEKTFEGATPDVSARQCYMDKKYRGKPYFVSEYGGIAKKKEGEEGWGYGNAPKNDEEFIDRYKRLTDVLLDNENMFGFCYTQLYDVEQEVNGLYTYDRKPKFDMEIFKKINSRKAAIED